MAKIKKRRVYWTSSNGSNVMGYRLYWSADGEVNYSSDFADVGNVTEVILPDHIPAFPRVEGNMELGVTAINEIGNESDLTKLSTTLQFTAPDAPRELVVETLQDYHIDYEKPDQPEDSRMQ